jgi:uncharacterized protein (TIGR03118 family)
MRRTLVMTLCAGALAGACTAADSGTDEGDLGPAPTTRAGALRVRMRALTADRDGVAAHTAAPLVNAWGLAFDPEPATGPEPWIAANGTDTAVIVGADGTPTGRTVAVAGAPTGLIYTESPDLLGDEFVFATEAGTILGWQDALGGTAKVRVDDSAGGAVYKGLAVFDRCSGHVALATTDFHGGKVDVYGAGYAEIEDAGFVDPDLPAGFAPFGIAALGGEVYVSYAKVGEDGDDEAGPGNGYVDVFNPDGTMARRLVSQGQLNSPWGMALAPDGMGALSHMLLVGNFGDGAINVYDPKSGRFRGQLSDESGAPLVIDGLWALAFGPATETSNLGDRLFFTAGPDDEEHGLFGTLQLMKGKK